MTTQLGDRILKEGEWMELYSNPLEQYWAVAKKSRPFFYEHFNCKRGYIASWEIKDDHLFLTDIEGSFERTVFLAFKKKETCSLKWLFPKLTPKHKRIKATWFTGKLRIPTGKMTRYNQNGYDSRFEKEQIITVDRGDITKIVVLDYVQHELIVEDDVSMRSK